MAPKKLCVNSFWITGFNLIGADKFFFTIFTSFLALLASTRALSELNFLSFTDHSERWWMICNTRFMTTNFLFKHSDMNYSYLANILVCTNNYFLKGFRSNLNPFFETYWHHCSLEDTTPWIKPQTNIYQVITLNEYLQLFYTWSLEAQIKTVVRKRPYLWVHTIITHANDGYFWFFY